MCILIGLAVENNTRQAPMIKLVHLQVAPQKPPFAPTSWTAARLPNLISDESHTPATGPPPHHGDDIIMQAALQPSNDTSPAALMLIQHVPQAHRQHLNPARPPNSREGREAVSAAARTTHATTRCDRKRVTEQPAVRLHVGHAAGATAHAPHKRACDGDAPRGFRSTGRASIHTARDTSFRQGEACIAGMVNCPNQGRAAAPHFTSDPILPGISSATPPSDTAEVEERSHPRDSPCSVQGPSAAAAAVAAAVATAAPAALRPLRNGTIPQRLEGLVEGDSHPLGVRLAKPAVGVITSPRLQLCRPQTGLLASAVAKLAEDEGTAAYIRRNFRSADRRGTWWEDPGGRGQRTKVRVRASAFSFVFGNLRKQLFLESDR